LTPLCDLVLIQVAHSQIWFFEPVDAPSSDSDGPPPYSSTDDKRYPEINEQTLYDFKNMSTGQYFSYFSTNGHYYVAPYGRQEHRNKISYVGNGNTFKLSMANTVYYLRYAGNAVSVVDSEASASPWVLERANDPSGGYYYHICPAFDTTQVISGETVPGVQDKSVFKVTTKKAGDLLQRWKFEL